MSVFDPLRTLAVSSYDRSMTDNEPRSTKRSAPSWLVMYLVGALIFVGGYLAEVHASPYFTGFVLFCMAYGAATLWLFLRHYRVTRR